MTARKKSRTHKIAKHPQSFLMIHKRSIFGATLLIIAIALFFWGTNWVNFSRSRHQTNIRAENKSKSQTQGTITQQSKPTPTPKPSPQPQPKASNGIWIPNQKTSWQWQLTTPVDQSVNAEVYDIDGFENSATVVSDLHKSGRHVICYIDVGAAEDYRPDYGQFPDYVKGNEESQWPGHFMLDIRRIDVLRPIMSARMDICKSKGFDAVEPDEQDIYLTNPGFPLTKDDQIAYNRFIADLAHARGMSVGLKNGVDMVGDLLPSFDWELNEECFAFQECDKLMPFINAGKAVFQTEYNTQPSQFCADANNRNFNSLYKHLGLDAYRIACR